MTRYQSLSILLFSTLFLSVFWHVNTQTSESPCVLADGRQCQYQCEMNSENVMKCKCQRGYRVGTDNITCIPVMEVFSIYPTFGPEAGGTYVSISGRNLLREPLEVKMGTDIACQIMNMTHNSLVFSTPEVSTIRSFAGQKFDISIFSRHSQIEIKSPVGFTYRPDPVIKAIQPRSSLSRGGIRLTVSGENMMSVAEPKLNFYAITNGIHVKTTVSDCELSTNTTFFCTSPDLSSVEDTEHFIGFTLDGITKYDYNGVNILRKERQKAACRDYQPFRTPIPGTSVTRTFPTTRIPFPPICQPGRPGPGGSPGPRGPDGSTDVDCIPGIPGEPGPPGFPRTSSDAPSKMTITMPVESTTLWYPFHCPVCGSFTIFPDPTIDTLSPEELSFRPYSPFNHKYLTIKGKNLERGLSATDYTIFVGDSVCEDILLSPTHLICSPKGEPKKNEKSDSVLIVVQIGVSQSNRIYVGKFLYEDNLWHYKPARIGFISVIAIVPILVIGIVVCVTLSKKTKKDHRRNWIIFAGDKSKQSNGNEAHYLHTVTTNSGGMEQQYLHPPQSSGEDYLHPQQSSGEDYLHPTTGSQPA